MSADFNLEFISSLKKQFPITHSILTKSYTIAPKVFSPFLIEIPQKVFDQVKNFVKTIYEIKESSDYQQALPQSFDLTKAPINSSILSCFDFHYSSEMGLKLIEINTNASLYLASQLFYESRGLKGFDPGLKLLLESFKISLNLKDKDELCILDLIPEKEGLYFEFLLYKEWLEQHSYPTEILSLQSYELKKPKKVYNRFTDFYLESPGAQSLANDYWSAETLLSPQPREYFLMADKKRLNLLKRFLEKKSLELGSIIPESKTFSDFSSAEELWRERKKYFFKPSQSYGGKGVFNGKGISRKAFDEILQPELIAQELCPADRKTFDYDNQSVEMKYDLRFYAFNGQVQQAICRLYQGQTTNMRTELGGIAPLVISS